MTINAHPLSWPVGWKRTEAGLRTRSNFKRASRKVGDSWVNQRQISVIEGITRVSDELRRMGVVRDDWVISTNLKLRLDGLPRSDQAEPADPGVAVYWEDATGGRKVMAIDQYDRVADNLAAIAATLEAMRSIERHGGAAILERAFTGFVALPPPSERRRPWWEVLGFVDGRGVTRDEVRTAYKRLAGQLHPDRPGGSHEKMAELNSAQVSALEEVIQ